MVRRSTRRGPVRLLSAAHNLLRSLPDSLGALRSLATLWLSHNRLDAMPAACTALLSLEDLNLHDNRLTAVPEDWRAPNLPRLSCARAACTCEAQFASECRTH